jgi:hypothetical protein
MLDIYVIHNQDLSRQDLIINQLKTLKSEFQKMQEEINIIWVGNQEFISLKPVSLKILLKSQIIRIVHTYNFSKYRRFPFITIVYNLIFDTFRQITIWLKPKRITKMRYFMKIQKIVNYKHDLVLRMISNSNVDNALVFEDDAVISDVKQFVAEINKLSEVKVDKFINLVNVVSIENLCVNKLITERISSELYLGKPITNGLCAYFLNRSFASSMLNERLMNKNFDYLPCDFAFNELFLRLSSYKKISESSFYSKLYLNPLVEHGSQSLFKDNSVSSILNDKPK